MTRGPEAETGGGGSGGHSGHIGRGGIAWGIPLGGTSLRVQCRPNNWEESSTAEYGSYLHGGGYEGRNDLHDDPLVITPIFRRGDNTNVRLHRVLVDTEALVDVLYWNVFVDLGLFQADLLSIRTPV